MSCPVISHFVLMTVFKQSCAIEVKQKDVEFNPGNLLFDDRLPHKR